LVKVLHCGRWMPNGGFCGADSEETTAMTTDETRCGLYTEEQWKTILSTLPTKVDTEKFRREILVKALCLQLRNYAMPPQFEKDWRRIANAARRFHMAVTQSDVSLLMPSLLRLVDGLPELAAEADLTADFYRIDVHDIRSANNIDVERDAYLRELLQIWIAAGGELKVSNRREAAGPLIEFLLATAEPPLRSIGKKMPTKEALRAFIRKERRDSVS
jgi:hypothetical protein